MNILVINGSPKGDKSNSMKLTRAFFEGMGDNEVQIMTVAKMNLASCKGCFSCWNKTPGKCVMDDDMKTIIEGELWAGRIIWGTGAKKPYR